MQRSYSTIHGQDRNGLNVQLAGTDMDALGFLKKIDIGTADIDAIASQLLSFSIGNSSIFPDLDGLFKEVNAIHSLAASDTVDFAPTDAGDTQAVP